MQFQAKDVDIACTGRSARHTLRAYSGNCTRETYRYILHKLILSLIGPGNATLRSAKSWRQAELMTISMSHTNAATSTKTSLTCLTQDCIMYIIKELKFWVDIGGGVLVHVDHANSKMIRDTWRCFAPRQCTWTMPLISAAEFPQLQHGEFFFSC